MAPLPAAPDPAASAGSSSALSSMLRPVSLTPLQVVQGNPRLLVGDMQIYEWRDNGIVAKPRLLAEAFSRVDVQGNMGFPYEVQGTYPHNLYVQVKRIRFGAPGVHEPVLRWSKDRWQRLVGPLGDTHQTVVILESERGTLAVGCDKEHCLFQPVAGTPLVPRFSWQPGCSTRMTAVIDAAIDASGTVYVLGNECSTGRVVVESWPKGTTKSRVEVLSTATPRPADSEANDVGIAVFDKEPWVWGLEWSWTDGPATQKLLAHRADGAWPLEQLACDAPAVRGFVAWRGYQFAVCETLMLRPPGGSWGDTKAVASHPQLVDGQLVFEHDGGLSQFAPPDTNADASELNFDLPCAGHFIDLGIGKDVAHARKFIRRLGDARKEMVLAMAGDRDTMFLIAPDLETASAAASTLGLQSEPDCLLEDFHTFVTPD